MKRKRFIIGIDLGGTNLKIALLDLCCRIRLKKVLSTKIFSKREDLIDALISSVSQIIKEMNLRDNDIQGVGLGLPGPVDIENGRVHFFPNIPGWKDVNLRGILNKRFSFPAYLDNDANLMCVAEYYFGAGRGARNLVCITLGTGVGGGIIIEGRIYRGAGFAAGEIGHIPINEDGVRCNCGGRACLEAYIGNRRIEQEAKRLFGYDISLEELASLAKNGNKTAMDIWDRFALRLAVALTGVVNLLNPDRVVVGGGVANAGKFLFEKLRKVVKERAMDVQGRQVKILKSSLGYEAGLIGAAILVKKGGRL